ncbi:hypothetical protein HIM_04671 [Hirsutella minnesotensis 3608]|uniref:ER membrane protein complex subunit 1 n=1 Tax=Hirsutella minnesotensis 3608 TaxID=1043627 RepID=A0A0F8A141_9HYPO|nr:hypothetical protein HIM_04671 [Hirsutella minnesotensis 3608]
MRRALLQSGVLLGLSSLAAAIFKDEVGDVDFHYPLIGIPQVETTFFHRPRKEDKASLLYTLSDIGLLGAVNPSNGDLVWRHQLGNDVTTTTGGGFLRAPEGENWVAAAYGSSVQAWSALTGRNIWRMDFKGEVKDVEILEMTETSRKDVLALFDEDGATVLRRLHGSLGTVVWEFREHSKDVPLQVSNNIANVYVVSLHGSGSSYSLKVTSLETATGKRVDHWMVGSKGDVHGPDDVMFVGANSAAPIVAWANQGAAKLSVNVLGSKTKQDLALPPNTESVQIHAPHLTQSQTHFLVHARSDEDDAGERTNKGLIFHTDLKTSRISLAYELPAFKGHGAFCTSSDGANVHFAQINGQETLIVSSESHGILARWPNPKAANVGPVHAVAEVIKKPGGQDFAVRAALVTSSDDWILLRNGEKDWTRPEGLSGSVAAVWAELPEAEDLAKVLAEEAHTNPLAAYVHRVKRHIDDLKYLPGWLSSIPERVINSVAGGEVVGKKEGLRRDTFGFSKVLVVATRRGRFYGLDSGNHGKIVWTNKWFPRDGTSPLVVKGLVFDEDHGFVSVYGSRGEHAVFNATSGVAREVPTVGGVKSDISHTAIVLSETGKYLVPLGNDDLPISALPADWDPEQTIVVRSGDVALKGIRLIQQDGKTTKQEMWQIEMRPGQKIQHIASLPAQDQVASIGRVLADRRVLYKYLNSNSIVVATADESAKTLSVQLVDTASGQILSSQRYNGVDASKSISCAMAENWYACSFFGDYVLDDKTDRSIKGYQLIVTDLYESPEPNSRGPLGDAANYSSFNPVDDATGSVPLPWALSQAYVMSQPLTNLAVTQTRQGISTRELIAYLPEGHGIVGLSRFILDPRRPVGRDPTAAEMEAETLMKYAPALEIDPRTILSHERDVVGVKGIIAAAAVVESTSILAAYGVDVYVARVAPSGVFDILGRGFNKVTLVMTVLALTGGVAFLAPMVRRKQIDRRWEAFL